MPLPLRPLECAASPVRADADGTADDCVAAGCVTGGLTFAFGGGAGAGGSVRARRNRSVSRAFATSLADGGAGGAATGLGLAVGSKKCRRLS